MLTEKNKITTRQAFILFVNMILSPAIRIFPEISAKFAKQAAWTAPILAAAPLFLLCVMLGSMFKKNEVRNLSDVFELSIGKIAGKILLSIYLLWVIILYFLYIRYYAERLLSSVFPNTDIRFFLLTMMAIVFIAARGRLEAFARFSEVSFFFFTLVLIVFFIFLLPNVKVPNVLPITYYDFVPAAKAVFPILGVWVYITPMFFLGDSILYKDQIKKHGGKTTVFLMVMTTLIIFFVVGSLGYTVAQRMELPFFNAIKLITLLESLDRLESILLSVWVVADFIVITAFAFFIMQMTKFLFSVNESKYFAFPVALLGFFGSLTLSNNRFELEKFTNDLGIATNVLFFYIIPVIILAVGKLRKKI